MRLLYVCSDFGIPPEGTKGASIHLRSISGALAELGHDVRLLSPLARKDSAATVPAVDPQGASKFDRQVAGLRDWLVARGYDPAVSREFRSLAYNAWAPAAARQAMGDWRPDAVLERMSLHGHVGVDLAEALHVPLVLEVNALLTQEAAAFRSLELAGLAAAIEQRCLERADAVVAVSTPLARGICQRGHAPAKVHVVPNGVDVRLFNTSRSRRECRAALGYHAEFVVGFCGSLKAWHGVDVLVDAFGRLVETRPDARLLIVGDGPCATQLHALVAARGLEAVVRFTGAVPHGDVAWHLRAVDVAVAPFRALDQFYFSPIKLFEYMAAGACVVASRVGQIAEVVQHDHTGLLCKPDDPGDLAAALAVLAGDPVRGARLARAGARSARENYTWSHAARRVADIVSQVCCDRSSGAPQRPLLTGLEVRT